MSDPAHDWRESLDPLLARLEDFELPQDFPFDFSPDSLNHLEAALLDRFGPDAPPPPDTGFVDAAMAYLGETLMRVGGGHWEWDSNPVSETHNTPLVRFDSALDRPALAPLDLMIVARQTRTGTEFSDMCTEIATAVATYRTAHPSWQPHKEHTPGIDEIDVSTLPQDPWLTTWLADREAAFPAWISAYGGDPDSWDFTPESLDALETLARQRLTTIEDVDNPANTDFVQGAAWYIGEVPCRTKDARWLYTRAPEPGSANYEAYQGNPWVGQPYVAQNGRDGNTAMPIAELEVAILADKPGTLRERYASYR